MSAPISTSARLPFWRHVCAGLFMAAFAALCVIVGRSPVQQIYDEPYQLGTVERIDALGWLGALQDPDYSSAVGPLFPAIQWALEPLTGLYMPVARFVNILFLLGTFLLIWKAAAALEARRPAWLAVSLLAVPFIWPVAGMALTEMPAIFFFSLSTTVCLYLYKQNPTECWSSWFWSILAGLALGAACLGRQTYLAAFVAVPALALRKPALWKFVGLIEITALLSAGWLFWLWGGLVPASQRYIDTGPVLAHGVTSLGYLAAATVLLAPRWFVLEKSWPYWCGALAGSLGMIFPMLDVTPARSVAERALPVFALSIYTRFASALLLALAALWLVVLLARTWETRRDGALLFLHLGLLALALTPLKVTHQYSSRYSAIALSSLVLVTGYRGLGEASLALFLRSGAGCAFGFLTLRSYFLTH